MYSLLRVSMYLLLNTLLCNSQTPFTGCKLVFQNSKIGLETFLIEKPCFLVFHFPRKVWFSSYDVTEEQTNTNKLYYKTNSLGIQLCLFFFYNSHSRLNPMKVLVVLPHIGPIIAWSGTTCIVYVFSRTLQSGLPSIESTHHVLCNKCSLA